MMTHTHTAYCDESTCGRFGSVSAVTLPIECVDEFDAMVRALLADSGVKELKWEKIRQARDSIAAKKIVDACLTLMSRKSLRVDVLIWDTQDERHLVPGRDDVANAQRMYYHLLKNVLRLRWSRSSLWALFPDEHTAFDWQQVGDFLDATGTSIRRDGEDAPLFGTFGLRLQRDFGVVSVRQMHSHEQPIIQVADLFAGIGAWSYASYEAYSRWSTNESAQTSWLASDNLAHAKPTNSESARFPLLRHLNEKCKSAKLGVSLRTHRGLRTMQPANPLNFWLYRVQHQADKAPSKQART